MNDQPAPVSAASRPLVSGITWGLAAGLLLGLMSFLVHRGRERLPSAQFAFFRALLGLLVLLPWVLPRWRQLCTRAARALWLRAGLCAVGILCIFVTVQNAGLGAGQAIRLLAGTLLFVGSWRLARRLSGREGAVVGLILLGIVLLIVPLGLPHPGIVAVAGLGVVSLASAEQLLKRATAVCSPALLIWSLYLVLALLALCVPGRSWVLPRTGDWGLLLGVGLCGLAGQFCLVRAFAHLPPAFASCLKLSSLLWAVALKAVVEHARPGSFELGAYACMFVGFVLLQCFRRLRAMTPRQFCATLEQGAEACVHTEEEACAS